MKKISAVIAVSKGEEAKLSGCIESLKNFASEIIVYSLGANIVAKNVKVIEKKPVSYVELVRNEMINECKHDWIILLDPDERISLGLKKDLREIMEQGKFSVVNIPRKNIFFGKWIRHTNWWPDRQYRFFKRGSISWKKIIHSYPETRGKIIDLEANPKTSIIHYGYDNLGQFIRRQIRYSKVEAENKIKNDEKFNLFKLIYYPSRNFVVRYIKHMGFLDGFYGFVLSFLTSVFIFYTWLQIWYQNTKS